MAEDAAPTGEPADTEIIVYGDLFARWDQTRWHVRTEMVLPYEMRLHAGANHEFDTPGLQVDSVLSCDKDVQLGRHRWQVDCRLEDIAVRASVVEKQDQTENRREVATAVLEEIDRRLTGSRLQLQVDDKGQVVGIDLEGLGDAGGRLEVITETLASILSRVTAGFDMRLRPGNQLHEGKWHETDVQLMSMPLPPSCTRSAGSNMVVHYLNRFRGNTIVQSIGKGLIDAECMGSKFDTNLIGVSAFDVDEGYMTERVWAIQGESTAGTFFATRNYWNAGRIAMLGKSGRPDLGSSHLMAPRGEHVEGLADWVPVDP
jgi:hypothetical protein